MSDADRSDDRGAALVTGASRGIGYELARLLAGTGQDVVLVARTESDLREAADYFEERFDVEATVLAADLSERDAPREVYEACQERDIEVETLVNNAGFGSHGRFVDTDLERELEMIDLNVSAVTHLTKLFAREMADRGRGEVLNVASGGAFAPGPRLAVYYATKSYVLSFSEAIAEELDEVTVTCLCPGPVDTAFRREAGTEDKVMNHFLSNDPRSVARAGFRGMRRGDTVVVPSKLLKAGIFATRLLPRWVVRKGSGILNRQSRTG